MKEKRRGLKIRMLKKNRKIDHTPIVWIPVSKDMLPKEGQKILFYSPYKLTKIGEMTYFNNEEDWFLETITHYALPLQKPNTEQ